MIPSGYQIGVVVKNFSKAPCLYRSSGFWKLWNRLHCKTICIKFDLLFNIPQIFFRLGEYLIKKMISPVVPIASSKILIDLVTSFTDNDHEDLSVITITRSAHSCEWTRILVEVALSALQLLRFSQTCCLIHHSIVCGTSPN